MSHMFDHQTWRLTMDWLSTGEFGLPQEPDGKTKIAQAAERNPEIAAVGAWRAAAEPLPEWARQVDTETPHWGVEICNVAWLAYLDAQVRNIGGEEWHPADGWCGSVPPPAC